MGSRLVAVLKWGRACTTPGAVFQAIDCLRISVLFPSPPTQRAPKGIIAVIGSDPSRPVRPTGHKLANYVKCSSGGGVLIGDFWGNPRALCSRLWDSRKERSTALSIGQNPFGSPRSSYRCPDFAELPDGRKVTSASSPLRNRPRPCAQPSRGCVEVDQPSSFASRWFMFCELVPRLSVGLRRGG